MKSGANHGWIIPKEVLKKELPEVMEYLENEEKTSNAGCRMTTKVRTPRSPTLHGMPQQDRFLGSLQGLELVLDYTVRTRTTKTRKDGWSSASAYTINPAFKEIGGEEILWTTCC